MINGKYRDWYAGGIVLLFGVSIASIATRYDVGTLTRMGPGFFPVVLGVVLACIGLMIAVAPSGSSFESVPVARYGADARLDLRGGFCITASVFIFIVLAENGGLLPAAFCSVFIASRADRTATFKGSLLLAAALTIFSLLLFSWGLQVQLPIIRAPWG